DAMRARIVTPIVLFFAVAATALGAANAQTPAAAATAPLPPEKPAMTEQEKEKKLPAKQLFGEKQLPSLGKAVSIGYYPRGCLAGRRRISGKRVHVEGDALFAKSLRGAPEPDKFPGKICPRRGKGDGLERHSGRRPVATPRWTLAIRSRQSSDRPRRRHLVHAD